jgi:hypothetical protein
MNKVMLLKTLDNLKQITQTLNLKKPSELRRNE